MFIKVMKLLVKSRFSRAFLLILFGIFAYSFFVISFGFDFNSEKSFGSYYLAFFFLLFLLSATVGGGLSVTRADLDFLLTSAVRNRDLIPAFFIAQALSSSLIFIAAASGAIAFFRTNLSGFILGIVAIICMAILPISMSLNMAGKGMNLKVPVAAIEAGWIVSSFIGFPYGALSFITYLDPYSSLTVIILTIVATAVAATTIRGESLPFRISSFSMRTKNSYDKSFSFKEKNPVEAIMSLHFRQVDFTSRVASMGNIRVKVNRVSIYMLFAILSAIAFVVTFLLIEFQGNFLSTFGSFGIYLLAAYFAWFLSLMLSTGTLSKERAWLSFTSIPIEIYLRKVMEAKILQTLFASVPFIISFIVLGIYISHTFFIMTIVLILFPPLYSGINFSLSFLRKPYQILQENILPSTYNASQFAVFPITFTMLIALFVVVIFPVTIPLIFAIDVLILLYLSFRKSYWQKRLYQWIERGYQ
ncbi:hypothetical protein ACNF40_04140 [Cuniculiplasma sp. SKW4]|uniref:hypothetical protein n=1 Tax=Cuniculiplasma sp. SKW4 TaxID=3400171 RepID=UPI003FD41F67